MGTLTNIQAELKAPKNRYNSFGDYKYRSCEDILEAVKPLLKKHTASLYIQDKIVEVGGRVYVEATATFKSEDDGVIQTKAFAREPAEKKKMDDSQITGTASSYARKYALNGLFLIDDAKDPDTDEYAKQTRSEDTTIGKVKAAALESLCAAKNVPVEKLFERYGVRRLEDMTEKNYLSAVRILEKS